MLQTTPFWGETYIDEDDGFWLWKVAFADKKEKYPYDKLSSCFKFYHNGFNKCLNFLKNEK